MGAICAHLQSSIPQTPPRQCPSLNMLGNRKMYSIFHIKRQAEKTAKGVQPL